MRFSFFFDTHTGTYSVTSNGTKDMGASHSYRYVSVSVSTTPSYTFTHNSYSSATSGIDITLSNSGTSGYILLTIAAWNATGYTLQAVKKSGSITLTETVALTKLSSGSGSSRAYRAYKITDISAGAVVTITGKGSGSNTGATGTTMCWIVYA